jgi:dienelactone hydrolase
VGGYSGDDEKGLSLFGKLDRAKMGEDFLAAAYWLKSRPESTGKLGAIGFCFDEAAAKEAWQHRLNWFDKYLRR